MKQRDFLEQISIFAAEHPCCGESENTIQPRTKSHIPHGAKPNSLPFKLLIASIQARNISQECLKLKQTRNLSMDEY